MKNHYCPTVRFFKARVYKEKETQMTQTKKAKVRNLIIAAMLTALGILIPMMMPVKLIIGEKEIAGISRGIDEQGALLLEQDGVIKPWVGGEISLRSAE